MLSSFLKGTDFKINPSKSLFCLFGSANHAAQLILVILHKARVSIGPVCSGERCIQHVYPLCRLKMLAARKYVPHIQYQTYDKVQLALQSKIFNKQANQQSQYKFMQTIILLKKKSQSMLVLYTIFLCCFQCNLKDFQIILNYMLTDLKVLEDKLFLPQPLEQFQQKYPTLEVIKQLNKASKKETRDRIRRYLSKLGASNHYKDFLYACLIEETDKKKEFIKYVSSEHSQEFFELLQQKRYDVLALIENNQAIVPVLMKIIGFQFGIKLIKLFKQLYENDSFKYECLFNPAILRGLQEGLGFSEGQIEPMQGIDSVAQMRYLQIVVNIAIVGGKCFNFVGELLNKALNLYNTEDILLKMAIVQIISVLGDGVETSKLLHQHKIWKYIEKDASDVDQQFYVRKFLLLLLTDMIARGHYSLNPKMTKDIQTFLRFNLTANGEFLEAAIDLIGHLFRSTQGTQLVIQDKQIFNRYVKLSVATLDSIKKPFYESLQNLTQVPEGKIQDIKKSAKYRLVVNILNCIGNPESAPSFSSSSLQTNYIQAFNKWFTSLLKLPFEDAELILIEVFINLLNYYQVVESLFQISDTTKYLLKVVPSTNTSKTLKSKKNQLIGTIIRKGEEEWKGLQVSEYSRNLDKLLKSKSQESVYALDVQ